MPPFAAVLKRYRSVLAGIHELTSPDGENPLVVDDWSSAADTSPVEVKWIVSISCKSDNWGCLMLVLIFYQLLLALAHIKSTSRFLHGNEILDLSAFGKMLILQMKIWIWHVTLNLVVKLLFVYFLFWKLKLWAVKPLLISSLSVSIFLLWNISWDTSS